MAAEGGIDFNIVGSQVQVKWGSGWHPATIREVNEDGTLNLLWHSKGTKGRRLVTKACPVEKLKNAHAVAMVLKEQAITVSGDYDQDFAYWASDY
mmetsp:Transcript_42089/g.97438  ORF Transcript_42089/g.97438 Transcript_42089/m.97438 type:complete len:95 (+) Transcript_42089:176-460(+)|eukprot:CAMPEP_0182559188 /NCGR_PEP_ID=MMETSP1324-20130603/2400_1 /TAXON_ID=236786 /ORGANISM="Florenciella sp., Strain RCC1587" /LENGTH=94 /DNA_ID=CAMNT_0024771423 /DNA_START=161 /DNA_END=445 /DNA_ORIENTATION=+